MSETFRENPEAPGAGDGGQGTWREGVDGGTSRESGAAGGVGFARAVLSPCLSDRFTVVGGLPAGGESDVLLVADQAGSRWVVKQYRRPGWSPSMDVLDVLEDLKVGHSLQSWVAEDRTRHLVWLQEWGTDPSSGLFFEVQEYVAGGALAAGGGSSVGDWPAGVFAEALIDAVAGFHRLVGAHRDLKPANLLVRSADPLVLVVADVGLSRNVGESSHRFSKRDGSPAYQAPEAAAQGKVSRAGDWWAVGVMVAEAVLGRHPLALEDGSLPDDRVLLTEVVERDIPLDGVQDSRLRLLCEGLLTRDSEQRWRLPQISAWRAGESPKTGYAGWRAAGGQAGSVGGPVRTVLFAGVEYDSPQGLAAAFAADPDAAAQVLFLNRDATTLTDLQWMLRAHGLHDAQGLLDGYRSGPWQRTFLRLLAELDPNLVPVLAGQSMAPQAMADLACGVVAAGEVAAEQMRAMQWVTEHDVWRLWRRLPGMAGAAEAAGRLVGFAAADGVAVCGSAPVEKATIERFWDQAAGLGQAWMLWWAVDPPAASDQLNTIVQPLRDRGGVNDQTWWHDLVSTDFAPGDAVKVKQFVAAGVGYPLAAIAQREFDRRMAEAQAERDRAEAGRLADIQHVRDVLLPRLARQGEAFLELRREQLRKDLRSARRPSLRGSNEQRLQRIWEALLRLRYSLLHRYGAEFPAPLDDAEFQASRNKPELLDRELNRNPAAWCAWSGSEMVDWIPPSPVLIALWGAVEDGQIVGGLVDPIVGDLVDFLRHEPGQFGRTEHGRILVGQHAFPEYGDEPDAALQQVFVHWAIAGPEATELAVRSVHKRVEVTLRFGGRCIWAFAAHSPPRSHVVFSMPDGDLALATLSEAEIQEWDLTSGHESLIRLSRFAGANRLYAPVTGGGW